MSHVLCLEIFVSPTYQCTGRLHRMLCLGREWSQPDHWLCWTLYLGLEKTMAQQQQPLPGSLWECPVPAPAGGCWVMWQREPHNLSGVATWFCLLLKMKALQNRREAGNCPADRIWAKCCGKMHLSCTQCCTKTRFPDSERVQKFFTINIPLLLKWLFIKPFVTWSFYLNTERTLLFQYHAPFPSAEHQAGQEAQNLAGMKRILYE